jgi:hypothetical protein
MYASAQSFDFLATTKNPSFPIRKLARSLIVEEKTEKGDM